jgi:hypothetical protein
MAYRFDDMGWYDGEVPDGSPRSTGEPPPITSTTTTPGEERANWSGLAWVVVPFVTAPPPQYPVPAAVTMRQARLALLGAGLLSSVDAAIDAMSEPTKSAARIEWEYSNELQRSNPLVLALGPALNLTSEQIDALFVAASTL